MESALAGAAVPVQNRFRDRFWPLFLLGLLGIATLPFALIPLLRLHPLPPGAPDIPLAMLVALSMIQPTLLLAGTVALGAWLAPRLGLRSHLVASSQERTPLIPRLAQEAPLALVLGLVLSVGVALLDAVFAPYLGNQWAAATAQIEEVEGATALFSGVLYGGITEELMLRWGMLSFFAWVSWRLVQREQGLPRRGVMWTAIVLSALLFGLGHLPAVAAVAPLTSMLVLRTVLLNAMAGLLFGWLFWRRSLEAAMLAHASAHVGFVLLAGAGIGA